MHLSYLFRKVFRFAEMTKQTYNEQVIAEYLLGSLPEAENARLDELSFTDDDFNAALESVEKDLVDTYARGELRGAKLEKFNSHYLATPRRREMTGFAQAFQVFVDKPAVKSVAPIVEEQKKISIDSASLQSSSGWLSALKSSAFPRLVLQWVFAAVALTLLIAGGWLLFENLRLRQQINATRDARAALQQRERELQIQLDEQRLTNSETEKQLARVRDELAQIEQQTQEQQRAAERERTDAPQIARLRATPARELNIASFDLMPQTRGVGSIATVSVPAMTNYVTMRLGLETDAFPVYRVVLRNQSDNKIVWRSGNLKARTKGENKILNVALPADLLQTHLYVLEVSGVTRRGASEFISSYPFRVVR